MTKTANENEILTRVNIPDTDKTASDWTVSVTSTEDGLNDWEIVPITRYEQWKAEWEQAHADDTGEVEE